MANFNCDGVGIEIPNDVLPVVKGWIDRRDTANEDLKKDNKKLLGEKEKTETELDAMKGKCDALEAEIATLKSTPRVDGLSARRSLERQSLPYISKANPQFSEDGFDTMSDRAIKESVIAASLPKLKDTLSNRTDAAIDAMYEVAISEPVARTDSAASLRNALGSIQSSHGVSPIAQARIDEADALSSAWTTALGGK